MASILSKRATILKITLRIGLKMETFGRRPQNHMGVSKIRLMSKIGSRHIFLTLFLNKYVLKMKLCRNPVVINKLKHFNIKHFT